VRISKIETRPHRFSREQRAQIGSAWAGGWPWACVGITHELAPIGVEFADVVGAIDHDPTGARRIWVVLDLSLVTGLQQLTTLVTICALRQCRHIQAPEVAAIVHGGVETAHVIVDLISGHPVHEEAMCEVPICTVPETAQLAATQMEAVQQAILGPSLVQFPLISLVAIIVVKQDFLGDPIDLHINNCPQIRLFHDVIVELISVMLTE